MKSSVEKIEVMEPIIEAELGDMAASVQVYSNQVGPEDPAAHRFARELSHEGEARLSQDRPSNLPNRSPAEPQAGVNQPNTFLVERGLGGDGELRRILMESHYSRSSLAVRKSRKSDRGRRRANCRPGH